MRGLQFSFRLLQFSFHLLQFWVSQLNQLQLSCSSFKPGWEQSHGFSGPEVRHEMVVTEEVGSPDEKDLLLTLLPWGLETGQGRTGQPWDGEWRREGSGANLRSMQNIACLFRWEGSRAPVQLGGDSQDCFLKHFFLRNTGIGTLYQA